MTYVYVIHSYALSLKRIFFLKDGFHFCLEALIVTISLLSQGKKKIVPEELFQDQLTLLPMYQFCRVVWEMRQKEAVEKAQ